MGASSSRKNEVLVNAPKIPVDTINEVTSAVCKIVYENYRGKISGTGFFMKINDDLKCIATCYHVISKDIINNTIILQTKNKTKIELVLNERYIEFFEDLDITIIEIKDSDNISKDIVFLECESNYSKGYNQFKDSDVFTLQYPREKMEVATGKINEISKINDNIYEFGHNIDTENGSSGSPIILISTSKVIGIHKCGDIYEKVNYATFIGEIFKFKNFIKEKKNNNVDEIPSNIISKVNKSICKIAYKKNNEDKNGTGFFMILNNIKYLVTSYKILNKDIINNSIRIEIHNKIEKIIELKERNIKFLDDLDITILEIKESDDLRDIDFLTYDLNYIEGYNQYKDINILIFQYTKDRIEGGSGKIIDILSNYEFKYNINNININNSSFGSPILLPNTLKVIGINKHYDINDNKINYGTFIGEIFKNNKLNPKENGIEEIENENLDNDIVKIEPNENINKTPDNKNNNYITGEIYISEDNINKEIRIINSYEEMCREYNLEIKEEYKNENKIKECIIEIEGKKLLQFSYFYKFENEGNYSIKYTFKNILTNFNCLFCNCSTLIFLDLSNLDTQKVKDMAGMFSNCTSLIYLNLTNFNTQNIKNINGLFYNCISLTDLNLSNFDTKNIIDMGRLFLGCSSLENLDISSFNTHNVQNMNSMFKNCSSLKSLNIYNFNTQNVKNMSEMFYNCSSLKSLDLSNFNTQNVENMNNMFWRCSSLIELNLSNFNIRNVKDMSGMFSRCSSLISLNLSSFKDGDNLKDMSVMFSYCTSLVNLDLSNCNTENVENMKNIFADCSSLKNLNISHFNTNNVKNTEGIFRNCKELNINSIKTKDLRILNIIKNDFLHSSLAEDKFTKNNFFNKIPQDNNNNNINNYIIGEIYISKNNINKPIRIINSYEERYRTLGWKIREPLKNEKEIKECIIEIDGKKLPSFSYFYKFESDGNHTIIYSFKNLLTSCQSLFCDCSSIINLDFSNFNTKNVIYMSTMFSGCSSLKSLDLSNFNTENVRDLNCMFMECTSLESLNLSNFNLKNAKDLASTGSLFLGCSSLKKDAVITNEPKILNQLNLFSCCVC